MNIFRIFSVTIFISAAICHAIAKQQELPILYLILAGQFLDRIED